MSARDLATVHLPAAGWAALVAAALLMPADAASDLAGWFDFPLSDKLAHGALFLVMAALFVRSFRALSLRHALLAALLAASVYGAGSEVAQRLFTDRTAELADLAADVAGAGLAVAIAAAGPLVRSPPWQRGTGEDPE